MVLGRQSGRPRQRDRARQARQGRPLPPVRWGMFTPSHRHVALGTRGKQCVHPATAYGLNSASPRSIRRATGQVLGRNQATSPASSTISAQHSTVLRCARTTFTVGRSRQPPHPGFGTRDGKIPAQFTIEVPVESKRDFARHRQISLPRPLAPWAPGAPWAICNHAPAQTNSSYYSSDGFPRPHLQTPSTEKVSVCYRQSGQAKPWPMVGSENPVPAPPKNNLRRRSP